MTNSRIKFDEWARYAEEDLLSAKLLLKENGHPNQICFHSQQAAEKYLKGYMVFAGHEFQKVHQLGYLLSLCAKIEPAFEKLKEDAFYLGRFYIETRYPGDIQQFTVEEAKNAYEAALRVKRFTLEMVH